MLYHESSIRWRWEFLFPRPVKVHQSLSRVRTGEELPMCYQSALSTKPMEMKIFMTLLTCICDDGKYTAQ